MTIHELKNATVTPNIKGSAVMDWVSDSYEIECTCGWRSGTFVNRAVPLDSFNAHLKENNKNGV